MGLELLSTTRRIRMQMVQESAVHIVCTLCQQDDDGVAQCTFAILHGAAPNTAFFRQRAKTFVMWAVPSAPAAAAGCRSLVKLLSNTLTRGSLPACCPPSDASHWALNLRLRQHQCRCSQQTQLWPGARRLRNQWTGWWMNSSPRPAVNRSSCVTCQGAESSPVIPVTRGHGQGGSAAAGVGPWVRCRAPSLHRYATRPAQPSRPATPCP